MPIPLTTKRPLFLSAFAVILALGVGSLSALAAPPSERPFTGINAPDGFIPPPLHPAGVELETRELAPGVYALLSNHTTVDNSGFVVGENGVLVIDAHINGEMAGKIQNAVRTATDKPILYLVNTNHHGDHTFGNYAFPPETRIIAHRATAARMRHFESEKAFMLATVAGDESVFGDARLRLPDIVFEQRLVLDLGGRTVELHHFGRGNTPGDTVVYVPEARAAWTGNLVVGEGTIPPIFEGEVGSYLETIAKFRRSLEVATIVPGHGFMTSGAILGQYLGYLSALLDQVGKAIQADLSLEETLAAFPLDAFHSLPPDLEDSPAEAFLSGLHRLNVQQAYLDLSGQ